MRKLALLLLLAAIPTWADSLNDFFQFTSNAGDIGPSASFTSLSGLQLTLNGYSAPNVASDLFAKNEGPTEFGIGMANGVDHEINANYFLQIDLRKIFAVINLSDGIRIGIAANSLQGGDSYNVYGSNVQGQLGTLLIGGDTWRDFTAPTEQYDFLSVTSQQSVLVDDIFVMTPEPSTLLLLGICLFFFFVGIYGFSSRVGRIVSK